MSRSYKKTPIVKYVYGNTLKLKKNLANKRIRKCKDVSSGGYFKKILTNTHYIYECRSYSSLQQFILENEIDKVYSFGKPFEKVFEEWQRKYYRK